MSGRTSARAGSGPWHVVTIVENLPLGADHRLRKQVETLLSHGCRVTVVCSRHELNAPYRSRADLTLVEYQPPPEPRGPLGQVVEYAWSGLAAVVLLARVRSRGRVDVVQLCQPPDMYFPLAGLLRRAGSRVVVDQRDMMPELLAARYPSAPRAVTRLLHLFERRTQRAVDHTITVNEHLRDRLEVAGGTGKVSVVWNGPVLARVDAARPAPELREGCAHLVVWVGKMGVQDRVELVVEVAEALVGQGRTDVRFAVIGDGERLEALRAEVTSRGLSPWVTCTGWLPEDRVFRYLATADVGLDTSLQHEVTPVKAIEYMSFGLPFAAFDLPETRKLAEDAALLAEPGDVDALARALAEILDHEPTRSRLSRAGRRRVEASLSWERQEPSFLAAVGPATDPGPPRSRARRHGSGEAWPGLERQVRPVG
ncbi:glycosyltransferase family 4 protein [Nocardioides agariphilus]|uniref:Glycosyltransferase family 4 protein n=1 Tax=Nocardioides agariphilus TaxID=433664 RepID=A0A930YQE8_9ACTN|nr:glycosyltransferase family 4 protein [Nocardioides agariphilus]